MSKPDVIVIPLPFDEVVINSLPSAVNVSGVSALPSIMLSPSGFNVTSVGEAVATPTSIMVNWHVIGYAELALVIGLVTLNEIVSVELE